MLKQQALQALRALLPKGQVFTDQATLIAYEVDAGLDKGKPDGVVFPHTAQEVQRLMRWAAEYDVPLVARGAGTGLSGGAVADRGGVIVEFSHMNRILDFDELGRSVVAQPAVINLSLDERVKLHGLYFPPDPASQRASTIGGNVAENSGGPHCFKYGVTTNYVTGMQVVLADGSIVRVGGHAFDYPEYDLCGLITGSEGMLALITSITTRLLRNPPGVRTMLAIFRSVEEAGAAVSAVIAAGLLPATLELMDQKIIGIVEPFAHAGLPLDAKAILVIDIDGYPESLDAQVQEVQHLMQTHGAYEVRTSSNDEERAKIWLARKSVAGAITRLAPAYYTVDVTVPRSRLAEILVKVDEICERYTVRTGYLLHAGDGNLHPMMLIPEPDNPEYMRRVHHASWEMVKCCVDMGGSLTGEHGVGIEKREYMSLMHTPAELLAMWEVKQAFDPHGILNPGKVFPHPKDNESGPFAGYAPMRDGLAEETELVMDMLTPATAEEAARALARVAKEGRHVIITGRELVPNSELAVAPSIETLLPADAMLTSGAMLSSSTTTAPKQVSSASIPVSTSRLSGIKTYAPDDLFITVGAGTPLREIQQFLAKDKKQVPLCSPWPDATLGGIISANINAPLRMRYGAIRDLVLCGTVALADGRVIRAGRPIVKNVAGFDLPKAFIGSHGTLGLWTDITLKLFVQPRRKHTLLYPVEDIRQGVLWGRSLLPLALVASAILLCKTDQLPGFPALPDSPYVLAYTAEGMGEDVEAELQQVRHAIAHAGGPSAVEVEQYTGNDLWAAILNAALGNALLVRVGVPVRDLPGYVQDQSALLNDGPFIADLANGLIYASTTRKEPDAANTWLAQLRQTALAREGYAIVLHLPEDMQRIERWGYQPEGLSVMRALKKHWDAEDILNRGVFLV